MQTVKYNYKISEKVMMTCVGEEEKDLHQQLCQVSIWPISATSLPAGWHLNSMQKRFFFLFWQKLEMAKSCHLVCHLICIDFFYNCKHCDGKRFAIWYLTLSYVGFFSLLSHVGGGSVRTPPLVSQLWGLKNSKTQFSRTDIVLSFHLSSWSASWVA